MASDNWRGTVGIVRPTQRMGGFEELLRMLPDGIRLIPALPRLCAAVRSTNSRGRFAGYEAKVAELAGMGVDVINPSGAPPLMVQATRRSRS